MTAGLFISDDMDAAERVLQWANFRLETVSGPGFLLISPASQRRKNRKRRRVKEVWAEVTGREEANGVKQRGYLHSGRWM